MATKMRTIRTEKRIRLRELAEAAGVGIATVSDIEAGKYGTTVEIAEALARRLGYARKTLFESHSVIAKEDAA